jgi:hypothetical protein
MCTDKRTFIETRGLPWNQMNSSIYRHMFLVFSISYEHDSVGRFENKSRTNLTMRSCFIELGQGRDSLTGVILRLTLSFIMHFYET